MKTDIIKMLKKYSEMITNKKWIALIFILGLGLILLPAENKAKETKHTEVKESHQEYRENLEKDLKGILSQVKGVGKVDVLITLDDSGNTYFATDETENISQKNEEKNKSRQIQHVLRSNGSNTDEPLITGKKSPKISGVLICAEGANDSAVKNSIKCAVEALLGVGSHRIEVLERK